MKKTLRLYPKESCGYHLLTEIPTAFPNQTVKEAHKILLDIGKKWDILNYVYIIDSKNKLLGVVSIKDILKTSPKEQLSKIMNKDIVKVYPFTDQEKAAILAVRHKLKAIPVVERDNTFLGVIGIDTILEVLHLEHVEDFLRFSGIQKKMKITDILKERAVHLVRLRIPWLIIGLVGGMLATIIVSFFEITLKKELALAFFIPVIVYMSDAVGTQTETLFIRGLALGEINIKKYLKREITVTFLLGLILGIFIFLFASIWFRSFSLAFTVGLAMFITIASASLVAIFIPFTLYKSKKDPALGSGPFATVLQDILSLVIYLIIATLIIFH